MKKIIFAVFAVAVLGLTACGSNASDSSTDAAETAAAETTAETTVTTEETTTAEETTTEDTQYLAARRRTRDVVVPILESAFKPNFDFADVQFDEESNTYFVSYSNNGLGDAIRQIRGSDADPTVWEEFSANIEELAKKSYITVRGNDTTAHLELSLVNDADTDEVLIKYADGKLVFDATATDDEQQQ